jgi:hypothetical protein
MSTMVDFLQEYPGTLTPSNDVSERATASASGSPERKHAPPTTGGYENDGWLPNPTTHATLTGRCLKSADTWPSPSGGWARSAYINPVCLRLGIFLLTLGQKQINPHSRWEALHGAGASAPYTRTNGTPASPSPQPLLSPGRDRKPDARRAGAPTPPHLSSSRLLLPQPSTPPQGLPRSLTVWPTQPGMLTALSPQPRPRQQDFQSSHPTPTRTIPPYPAVTDMLRRIIFNQSPGPSLRERQCAIHSFIGRTQFWLQPRA